VSTVVRKKASLSVQTDMSDTVFLSIHGAIAHIINVRKPEVVGNLTYEEITNDTVGFLGVFDQFQCSASLNLTTAASLCYDPVMNRCGRRITVSALFP